MGTLKSGATLPSTASNCRPLVSIAMSFPIISVQPWLAQTPEASPESPPNPWMLTSGGLLVLLVGLGVFSQIQHKKVAKRLRFEQYKNRELEKKVKLALKTITKMEKNPDLIHSREFNLDYLRMRMDEELFHFSILNQLKVKVKQKLTEALRPRQAETGMIGVASKPRQVDEVFDVEYTAHDKDKQNARKRVLFRIQIRLSKLPTQPTSVTISNIIDCIETFLSPEGDDGHWQPTIQGRIAYMHWDQKAKPTPLLILEQSSEGVNVTFRSSKRIAN